MSRWSGETRCRPVRSCSASGLQHFGQHHECTTDRCRCVPRPLRSRRGWPTIASRPAICRDSCGCPLQTLCRSPDAADRTTSQNRRKARRLTVFTVLEPVGQSRRDHAASGRCRLLAPTPIAALRLECESTSRGALMINGVASAFSQRERAADTLQRDVPANAQPDAVHLSSKSCAPQSA